MTASMDYDICVIGSGPVGITAAYRAAAAGLSVLVVESGGTRLASPAYQVDTAGAAGYEGAENALAFGWGGTSQLWGGQLWPWAEREIAARPWLNLSAWDIEYSALSRSYDHLARLLPLNREQRQLLTTPPPDAAAQSHVRRESTWLSWRYRNFAGHLGKALRSMSNVTISEGIPIRALHHKAGHVSGLDIDDPMGHVRAQHYIMAAGTLGNIRLLAASGLKSPHLGRGFMDHLSLRVAEMSVLDWASFREREAPRYLHGALFTSRYQISSRAAEQHELPGLLAQWEIEMPATSPVVAGRDLARAWQSGKAGDLRSARSLLGAGPMLLDAVSERRQHRRLIPRDARVYLNVLVEQLPNPGNHVVASSEGLSLQWRAQKAEVQAALKFRDLFLADHDLAGSGLAIDRLESKPVIRDNYHLMGGTRASVNPDDGVVDPRSRHHLMSNLSVLGASTFPTGGIANPTFTAAALGVAAVDGVIAGGS